VTTASDVFRATSPDKDWNRVVEGDDRDFDALMEEMFARLDDILAEGIEVPEVEDYPRDAEGRLIPPPPAFEKRIKEKRKADAKPTRRRRRRQQG
jgi:hypothetical protein